MPGKAILKLFGDRFYNYFIADSKGWAALWSVNQSSNAFTWFRMFGDLFHMVGVLYLLICLCTRSPEGDSVYGAGDNAFAGSDYLMTGEDDNNSNVDQVVDELGNNESNASNINNTDNNNSNINSSNNNNNDNNNRSNNDNSSSSLDNDASGNINNNLLGVGQQIRLGSNSRNGADADVSTSRPTRTADPASPTTLPFVRDDTVLNYVDNMNNNNNNDTNYPQQPQQQPIIGNVPEAPYYRYPYCYFRCRGVSWKTQFLFLLVYVFRYMDINQNIGQWLDALQSYHERSDPRAYEDMNDEEKTAEVRAYVWPALRLYFVVWKIGYIASSVFILWIFAYYNYKLSSNNSNNNSNNSGNRGGGGGRDPRDHYQDLDQVQATTTNRGATTTRPLTQTETNNNQTSNNNENSPLPLLLLENGGANNANGVINSNNSQTDGGSPGSLTNLPTTRTTATTAATTQPTPTTRLQFQSEEQQSQQASPLLQSSSYSFFAHNRYYCYDIRKDTCRLWPIFLGCFLCTFVFAHTDWCGPDFRCFKSFDHLGTLFDPKEFLWCFSQFLEAFAMLPQYILVYRHMRMEFLFERKFCGVRGVFFFMYCLGVYRNCYVVHWFTRAKREKAGVHQIYDLWNVVAGCLEVCLFLDFLLYVGTQGKISVVKKLTLRVDDRMNDRVRAVQQRLRLRRRLFVGRNVG